MKVVNSRRRTAGGRPADGAPTHHEERLHHGSCPGDEEEISHAPRGDESPDWRRLG